MVRNSDLLGALIEQPGVGHIQLHPSNELADEATVRGTDEQRWNEDTRGYSSACDKYKQRMNKALLTSLNIKGRHSPNVNIANIRLAEPHRMRLARPVPISDAPGHKSNGSS